MKVGFTGTRKKISYKQLQTLKQLLADLRHANPEFTELHHGDCVGADAAAGEIARLTGWREVVHPPNSNKHRAFRKGHECRIHLPHLVRDQNIVDETNLMIAVPDGRREKRRSGTWTTIRMARKAEREIYIIYPDGLKYEDWRTE